MNKLSGTLRDELICEAYQQILKKSLPYLFKIFSPVTITKLTHIIEEIAIPPGEIIYSSHDNEDKSIFIVSKGEVELFIKCD